MSAGADPGGGMSATAVESPDGRLSRRRSRGAGGAGGQLQFERVVKRFGSVTAVAGVSFQAEAGESIVILGPSGCGKSTTLRLIAGFEQPESGRIVLGSTVLVDDRSFVPPDRREMSVVFQGYALWPHMTVEEHVAFGPSLRRRRPGMDVGARVRKALELVRLEGYEKRYPSQLSGGQQQRVALARALAIDPQLLLMDEPLSNLDTRLRQEMRAELRSLQRELGVTMLYVTHDQAEALSLADRVMVMNSGRLEQVGTPTQLYSRPRTRFVAASLGPVNLLTGTLVDLRAEQATVRLRNGRTAECGFAPDLDQRTLDGRSEVQISVRPIEVELVAHDHPDASASGEVAEVMFYGESVEYLVDSDLAPEHITVRHQGVPVAHRGESVGLRIDQKALSLLED